MTENGGALSIILSAAKNLFSQMLAKTVMQRSPGQGEGIRTERARTEKAPHLDF
jgi:hypothetical protein